MRFLNPKDDRSRSRTIGPSYGLREAILGGPSGGGGYMPEWDGRDAGMAGRKDAVDKISPERGRGCDASDAWTATRFMLLASHGTASLYSQGSPSYRDQRMVHSIAVSR